MRSYNVVAAAISAILLGGCGGGPAAVTQQAIPQAGYVGSLLARSSPAESTRSVEPVANSVNLPLWVAGSNFVAEYLPGKIAKALK